MADGQDITSAIEYRVIPEIPGIGRPGGDHPQAYQAGDDGSIWSCLAGGGTRHHGGYVYKLLKGAVRPDGYRIHGLMFGGRSRSFLTHYLILSAFVGPRAAGMHCCHNNGNKLDNRACNLRYDTPSANTRDKIAHGTLLRGEGVGNSKLTEIEIVRIKALFDCGVDRRLIAEAFGVESHHIGRIVYGTRWAHV